MHVNQRKFSMCRAHHWKFGDMKPVEGIKEEQVKSIILYVRALQKVNGIW